jgi:hypothetical protein
VSAPEQRGLEWVQAQTDPSAIDRAMKAGELDALLSGRDPTPSTPRVEPDAVLTPEQIAAMTPEQIVEAAQSNADLARRLLSLSCTDPGDVDQGARGPDPAGRTSAERLLSGKTPQETRAMQQRGDLDALLAGELP